MKRVMLAAALILGITGAGFAQQTPGATQDSARNHHKHHKGAAAKEIKTPEERAKLFTASLDKQLNLSEAQEKEIYNIQLENAKKFEAMRKEHQAGVKQNHSPGKAYAEGMDKINSVLTPEQRVAYQKLREERMKKIEEQRAQHKNNMRNSGSDSTQNRKLKTKK